jgi:hypothetical protein
MADYLRTAADRIQLPLLLKGVVEELYTADEMTFSTVPFKNTAPYLTYQYTREDATSPLGSQAASMIIPSAAAVTPSAAEFASKSSRPAIIISSVDIPRALRGNGEHVAVQIAKKSKQVARMFASQIVTGDGSANTTPDSGTGMDSFGFWMGGATGATIPTIQGVVRGVAAAGSLTLAKLDEIIDLVPSCNALFMRSSVIRQYRTLLRGTQGTAADMMQLPAYGRPVLTFQGIPIIKNDWLPALELANGTFTGGSYSSVYAVKFDEDDGVCAHYNGSSLLEVSGPTPIASTDKDNYTVVLRANLVMHSNLAVARLYYV